MSSLIKKSPFLLACLPLIFAWGLISILIPQGLHNDDFQLYFMYCNGGEGTIPFSVHSGVLLGCLLIGLNALNPTLCWYLIIQHFFSSAACLGLNIFATARCLSHETGNPLFDKARLGGMLAILAYINFQCIYFTQYTRTGILCACVSLFLLYDWWQGRGGIGKLISSLIMLITAYELRDQTITSFAILGVGALISGLLNRKHITCRRSILAAVLYPAILISLVCADKLTFQSSPDWNEAKNFCLIRIGIQDQRDNSGIDKTPALTKAGINPHDFALFKTFTYVPGFCQENSEYLAIARYIHQSNRIGLFNSSLAARFNILSQKGYQYKGGETILKAITPWIPIAVGLLFLIPGINRRSMAHAIPMLMAILGYFTILILFQRAVGRVLHPVLYAGGIWILTSPVTANKLTRKPLITIAMGCIALLMTLFCFRGARWFFTPNAPAWKYCAQHPENLYLTTSMQGLNLYPTGWKGVSLNYFANTNIIPISDGWCFYSPAYKAALQARDITNPYAVICNTNTYVITQNNGDEEWPLHNISSVHKQQFGSELLFKKCHSVGKFTFWQAQAKN